MNNHLARSTYMATISNMSKVSGIVHTHTRDSFLASLPQDALEALARTFDELLAKHVQQSVQDGPARIIKQNQSQPSTPKW